MKGKRYTTEQKIRILREAEEADATIIGVCQARGISEQTFHRWKREFGMMELDQASRGCSFISPVRVNRTTALRNQMDCSTTLEHKRVPQNVNPPAKSQTVSNPSTQADAAGADGSSRFGVNPVTRGRSFREALQQTCEKHLIGLLKLVHLDG